MKKLNAGVIGRVASHLVNEQIIEMLAKQLHENFRAACKSTGVPAGPHAHDHGWIDCGNLKKEYFRKRARLLLERSKCLDPQTLGQAESSMQALVFVRRSVVGGLSGHGFNPN